MYFVLVFFWEMVFTGERTIRNKLWNVNSRNYRNLQYQGLKEEQQRTRFQMIALCKCDLIGVLLYSALHCHILPPNEHKAIYKSKVGQILKKATSAFYKNQGVLAVNGSPSWLLWKDSHSKSWSPGRNKIQLSPTICWSQFYPAHSYPWNCFFCHQTSPSIISLHPPQSVAGQQDEHLPTPVKCWAWKRQKSWSMWYSNIG